MANYGLHTLAYKFFKNSKEARTAFENAFNNKVDYDEFQSGCFGSYGTVYNNYYNMNTSDTYGNFFFCMGAETPAIESAVQYFNDNFKNITLDIVAKKEIGAWQDYYSGTKYYGLEYGMEIMKKDPTAKFTVYMFRFLFNREYDPLARYILRIPLGFWLRCFSDYHAGKEARLDRPDAVHPGDYIQEALDWSNSKKGSNGSLISDYTPVPVETFMKFDDIELMNSYFSEPKPSVYYQGYSHGTLDYGHSILPYCVYFVIEHDGRTEL